MSELPDTWEAAPLDILCDFNPKHHPDTPRETVVSFVPMPSVSEVSGAIVETKGRPLSEVWKGYTHFQDGDVLFAKITPCMENGKVALAQGLSHGLGCGSTEFHVLRPFQGVDPRYVWCFLRQETYRKDAEQSMTGAVGQRRVPVDFVKGSLLPTAPTNEQSRIVEKVGSLKGRSTHARDELNHIPRLIERYKLSILSKAFSGELTEGWRRHGSEEIRAVDVLDAAKAQAIKVRRSNLPTRPLFPKNELPEGWELARLEDLCSCVVDGTHHTPDYTNEGVAFISVKDVKNNRVYFDDCQFISCDAHEELSRRCNPQQGDLLITKSGTIGRTAIVTAGQPFSLFVSVALIRPATQLFSIYFLKHALDCWVRQLNVASDVSGSTIKNLHLQDIKALGVPVPGPEEQRQIVSQIDAAFSWVDRIAQEHQSAAHLLNNLDQAILAKAFRGELVPQDPDDEPASVLLERIREERAKQPKTKRGRKKKEGKA